MQLTGINNTRILVTGAAGGIGQALVHKLAACGAEVIATDHESADLSVFDGAEKVQSQPLDVSHFQQVHDLVATIEAKQGAIDACVNVAGILRAGCVVEATEADWDALFAVNAKGVFNVCRAVAQQMKARGRGNIVTVSSNAAGVPRYGMAAYAASKAAATMFTRSLGLELAEYGIRCNIVAPGSTLTPMQTGMWQDETGGDEVIQGSLQTYKTGIPLGRIGAPEDVANAVIFFLSDQSAQTTMADLYVDGGATQRA